LKTPPIILTRRDSPAGADFQAGMVLPVDKPSGLTSFAVVHRVRRWTGVKKVGHAGTLDPAATGLVLLLTGRATRWQDHFMRGDKEYLATVLLGVETATRDLEGEIIARCDPAGVTREMVESLLRERFTGEIEQIPPAFSALKIGGVPSYRLARKGKAVELKSRRVTVHTIALKEWAPPECTLRLVCSSGFYVRSLAHDLGRTLGCGAALKRLVRTRAGGLSLDDAWDLETLEKTLSQMRGKVS
jgi:tRNA pseudouridine55 synthase